MMELLHFMFRDAPTFGGMFALIWLVCFFLETIAIHLCKLGKK